jgi:hypothetical protein
VKLVPLAQTKPRPQFGSAAGLITMSDDFDAPLEDFWFIMGSPKLSGKARALIEADEHERLLSIASLWW